MHPIIYIYKNESKHNEMGPVRQNPFQRTVRSIHVCVCIALCTIVMHNIAQNRADNFTSYPPDNRHCSDDVYLREGGFTASSPDVLSIITVNHDYSPLFCSRVGINFDSHIQCSINQSVIF